MFTVKATYRGETRKLTFPECNSFPSFDQLYHQLYRVFPISHAIVLSKLLFSPDASKSRILVSREVRTADEYNLVVAPFTGRLWSNPLLRFSVSDETPHKLPAIAHMSQPNASNPQKPVVSDAFHVAEPSFGRISYSHIPPPPIIFSSRPSPQEPIDVGSSFKVEAETKALPKVPQPDQLMDVTPCCAVSQTKKDIQNLIAGFKADLDSTIASLDKRSQEAEQVCSPTPPMNTFQRSTAPESSLSLPSVPVYPPLCQFNFCSGCTVIKQGAWFDCQKCYNKLCVTCHDTATAGDCFVGTGPHVWKKQTCTYCIEPSVPLPLHPTMSWGSSVPSLNNFGSPLLPSVPTMPPVARDEPTLDTAMAPPPVSTAVPATEPVVTESARNDSGRVVHFGVGCDVCESVIEGIRHKCLDCPDYDLCTSCITSGSAERHNPFHEFFEISEPGRVVVHNVFSGRGERESHGSSPRRRRREFSSRVSATVVHNATCDLCESRIRGARYKCVDCPDYDVCNSCFSITEEHHPGHGFVKLIRPDDFIRREKAVNLHLANCDSCKKQIRGTRYKCMHPECPDFDLCQDCEALPIAVHPSTHPFLKLKNTDTTIPLVFRPNPIAPQPVAYSFGASVRSPSPSRQPSPASSRAPSPPGLYEAGFMRNPGMRVEGISSPEIPPPPSPFYFRSESSRCQSPEYRYLNRSPSPVHSPSDERELYTRVRRSLSPVLSRSPSPPMMIPGAMPTMFTLPPLKSMSPLRTPPTEDNEPEDRAPSPLWKYTPYSRPAPYARSHSPLLIPGQFVPESRFSTRTSTPEPVCGYPVMAPVGIEHNASPAPPSPDWRQVYSPGSPFPVRLPAQSAPAAPREEPSHVLPPVQSLAANSGFWPENFQEILGIRHLMEDEPSFSRDLRWSVDENQAPVEESPLIGEGEPLLNRPASDALPDSERSARSLASILSNIHISSTNNPFLTAMETERQSMRTPEAPVPAVVSLPSPPVALEPLNAEYVADRSIPDGQVVAPGAEFLKAWVMRNRGNRAWPEDTELVFVAGESLAKDIAAMQPKLVGAVQPMEQIDLWTDELKAPEIPGRYVSYYRLRDGEGNLFGHSIWLDITVSETFHRDSPDALASSEEYMSSSSIIVMPHNAPTRAPAVVEDDNVEEQSPQSSMLGSPITAPSNGDDEISDSDSETSGSLLSVPDSDSDDELWQDSRSVFIEGGDSQATLRATNETQEPDEYVVLYDETTSSEEGE